MGGAAKVPKSRKSRSRGGRRGVGGGVGVGDNWGGKGWRLRMLVSGGCSKSAEIKKKQIPFGDDRLWGRGGGCGQLGGGGGGCGQCGGKGGGERSGDERVRW